MAQALAMQALTARKIVAEVISCGTFARADEEASQNAIAAMRDVYSLDISGHRARPACREDLEAASLVLTATGGHKSHLMALFPEFSAKIFTICEVSKGGTDISDPFGRDLQAYISCADQMKSYIDNICWEEML